MRQQGFWPRFLFSVCAVLLLIGAWAPWANATQYISLSPPGLPPYSYTASGFNGLFAVFSSAFGFSRLLLDLPFAWDGLFLIGLALVFAFWLYRTAPRRAFIPLFALAVAWLTLTTVTLAVAAYGIFSLRLPLNCPSGCPPSHVTISPPLWGFWLSWLAALAAWAATILLFLQHKQAVPVASTNQAEEDTAARGTRRSSMRWLAGLSYTLGALLWGVALAALPWLISGGCASLDVALDYVNRNCIAADVFDVDYPFIARTIDAPALLHLSELLLLVGLITAVVLWSRRGAVAVNVLAIVWLVLITLLTWIAILGVQTMMATTRQLHFSQPADWKFGIGMYLAIIGVVLCACGIALRLVPWRGVARSSANVEIAGS